jgi:hypothetical protein
MRSKHLNIIILLISELIKYWLILYLITILVNLLWHQISNNSNDYYMSKLDNNDFETATKYVSNRYPFGVVVLPAMPTKNQHLVLVAHSVNLTGVYYNPPHDSIAFINYKESNFIVKIGDTIVNTQAKVTKISSGSIVISEADSDSTITLNESGIMNNNYSVNEPYWGHNNNNYEAIERNNRLRELQETIERQQQFSDQQFENR